MCQELFLVSQLSPQWALVIAGVVTGWHCIEDARITTPATDPVKIQWPYVKWDLLFSDAPKLGWAKDNVSASLSSVMETVGCIIDGPLSNKQDLRNDLIIHCNLCTIIYC